LKVSPGMIRLRYNRLVEMGFLKVVAITNPLSMGYDSMAMIGIRTEPGRANDVCRSLVDIPETSYVVMSTGRFDVFAELVCRDLDTLRSLLTEKIQTIDGITSAESFVLLEIHKLAYGWGVGEVDVPPSI